MRNKKLVIALAVPVCVVLSYAAFAVNTPAKNAKPAAKPTAKTVAKHAAKPAVKTAAKPAAKPTTKPAAMEAKSTSGKFNQKAVLSGFWSGPDTAVVGTVDGVPVTKGETVKALWNRTAPDMVGQLLDQKMLENEAKKQHAELTPAEKDAFIKTEVLQSSGAKSVDEVLTRYKMTRERFDCLVEMQVLAKKLALKGSPIKDDEFAQYVKARHILVRFDSSITDKTQQEAAAKKKIDEIDARLKAGEDFAKVASEASEDPGSKEKGGDLGWFKKGRMVPEFENAAFSLKKGQVSEPIKSSFGYHIIKVEGVGKDAVGAEKEQLRKMINDERAPMLVNQYVMQLRSKCKIVNKLAPPTPPMTVPGAMSPASSGPRPGSPRMVAPRTPTAPPAPAPSGDKPTTPPPPPPPAP